MIGFRLRLPLLAVCLAVAALFHPGQAGAQSAQLTPFGGTNFNVP
jgi:hypothetical protein